jgi:phage major head subunit gpT-like protein
MAIISFGAGVLDSMFGKTAYALKAIIEAKEEEFEKTSQIKNIFKMVESTHWAEQYQQLLGGEGFAPVGEAGAYPEDDIAEGYNKVIQADTWKDMFVVTQEAIEDEQLGIIEKKAKGFSLLYGRTRELFAAHMLWGGVGTSITHGKGAFKRAFDTTCMDGLALFHAAHTSKSGKTGTQSNLFANAFSYDALSYIQQKMMNYTDDDGNLLNIMPDTIIIGSDPMLYKAVCQVTGSEYDPDNANNAINHQSGLWNIIRWPYLDQYAANASAWFLLDSQANDALDGLIFQDRVPLTVRSTIESNDNNAWRARARFGAGFVDWRPICLSYAGSGGTDATA